jgi:hypothetical protein
MKLREYVGSLEFQAMTIWTMPRKTTGMSGNPRVYKACGRMGCKINTKDVNKMRSRQINLSIGE